jgi:crotonobetainyl-CoA:carnitine CoA-transferase CaiB-like acyl-CoA transferase
MFLEHLYYTDTFDGRLDVRDYESARTPRPLDGLKVVDFTETLTGVHVTQTLADFGADVVHVERPGGNDLRTQPAWPFWGRGKRSVVLDLKDPDDREVARTLGADADVLVETWRPGVADRLGLGYADLGRVNQRLVYCSVTGFGRDTPWSHLKAYEPVVLAKLGGLEAFSSLSDRPGPSYVSAPYCTFSAGMLGLQGILAALVEREESGCGQRVETTLVQGILAHDIATWLLLKIAAKFSGAFTASGPIDWERMVPISPMVFRMMVGFSKDGRFMQFSQTSERLWEAMLRLTGLGTVMEERGWDARTMAEDAETRIAFWEKALEIIRSKTYDEWVAEFDREPDVWAEMFRSGSELLHHPQMLHDSRTTVIDDPAFGKVQQPGPLVRMHATPAELGAPAPALDQHGPAIRSAARKHAQSTAVPDEGAPTGAPLAGMTVIELGTYYAAPFGTTILADLGARVIKIEQLDGDPIRKLAPFPEVGGIKVLQGKESVAIDIASDKGRALVLELVRRADVVLQSFRAGVAERHGYTAADLLAVHPELVYLNAPGYGTDGPMGHRPAFAPTIGAGSGLGIRNVGGPQNAPQDPGMSLEDVKRHALRMVSSTTVLGHADGFAALGVASALLLGILAKKRGTGGQEMSTSMLSTMAHVLSEDMVEYEGRSEFSVPDKDLYGLGPLYRLYAAADDTWVFVAAPTDDDWDALSTALDLTADLREDHDNLAAVLAEKFAARPAAEWEMALTKVDVACVEAVKGPVEDVVWFGGGVGATIDIVTPAEHPVVGEYQRLKPLVRFSRSAGVTGPAPLVGQHTEKVLAELGYDATAITALRAENVLG